MIEGRSSNRTETTLIEGREKRKLGEITIDQVSPTPLNDISWPSARAGLGFKNAGTYNRQQQYGAEVAYPLYEATQVYIRPDGSPQKQLLSNVTSKKRCLFTGSHTGFFMHDPAWDGRSTDYYVIGVNPSELRSDIRDQAAIYHELGHALIVDKGLDIQLLKAALSLKKKDLPLVAMAAEYVVRLRKALDSVFNRTELQNLAQASIDSVILFKLMKRERRVDMVMRLFHERNAWAGGIRLQQSHGFPTGFAEKQSVLEYARFCLETYARGFGDDSFVDGLR